MGDFKSVISELVNEQSKMNHYLDENVPSTPKTKKKERTLKKLFHHRGKPKSVTHSPSTGRRNAPIQRQKSGKLSVEQKSFESFGGLGSSFSADEATPPSIRRKLSQGSVNEKKTPASPVRRVPLFTLRKKKPSVIGDSSSGNNLDSSSVSVLDSSFSTDTMSKNIMKQNSVSRDTKDRKAGTLKRVPFTLNRKKKNQQSTIDLMNMRVIADNEKPRGLPPQVLNYVDNLHSSTNLKNEFLNNKRITDDSSLLKLLKQVDIKQLIKERKARASYEEIDEESLDDEDYEYRESTVQQPVEVEGQISKQGSDKSLQVKKCNSRNDPERSISLMVDIAEIEDLI